MKKYITVCHCVSEGKGRPKFSYVLVTVPKLPKKLLPVQFRFRSSWFWPSFCYGGKCNLVSTCRQRLTAILSAVSGPSLKQLKLCNMTTVSLSICQWPYTEHVRVRISLLSRPTLPTTS